MTKTLLIVEDNPGDVVLWRDAFEHLGVALDLSIATDGRQALDMLRDGIAEKPRTRPDLVLLDINLPGIDGHTALEAIRREHLLESLPVIVLSSSAACEDIEKAYENHANAYVEKPADAAGYLNVAQSIVDFWLNTATLPIPA